MTLPNFENLGKISFLWTHSKLHVEWPCKLFSQYVCPPVSLRQYLVLDDSLGNPLAYVSWAYLNVKSEAKYILNPHSLSLEDWNSGDRLWLTDFISPFHKSFTDELIKELRSNLFQKSIARSLRVKHGSSVAKIHTYAGNSVLLEDKLKFHRYYFESIKDLIAGDKVIWV
jgi:cytolysin-activating lysine-acyltransferase